MSKTPNPTLKRDCAKARSPLASRYALMDKRTNPLALVWNILSLVGGIFGLSSMLDTVVDWKEPILVLLNQYRSFVRAVGRKSAAPWVASGHSAVC